MDELGAKPAEPLGERLAASLLRDAAERTRLERDEHRLELLVIEGPPLLHVGLVRDGADYGLEAREFAVGESCGGSCGPSLLVRGRSSLLECAQGVRVELVVL